MRVQTLPSYSAERYFLLSEIEQKSRLYFTDDLTNNGNNPSERIVLNSPLVVLYTKWQPLIYDEVYLFEKIGQLLANVTIEDADSSFIIVDAYINNEQDWSCGTLTPLMKTAIEGLKARTGICNIVIGITDNLGGLPGLEKCYDILEKIVPGYKMFPTVCDFVANDREEMMGHDPTLEPDARSGVFQLLCCSQDLVMEEPILNRILKRCKTANTSPQNDMNGKQEKFSINQAVYLIAILLFMYYISIYIKH